MEDTPPYGKKESEDEFEMDFQDEVEKKDKPKKKVKWKLLPQSLNEWVTLIIILLTLYLAWAYHRDISALQEIITYLQSTCSCP